MERFVTRHQDRIAGIVTGFDRMRFRGTLRSISYARGVDKWLGARHVLLKDFGRWAEACSTQLLARAKQLAADAGCPYEYLRSWRLRTNRPTHTRTGASLGGCPACCGSIAPTG